MALDLYWRANHLTRAHLVESGQRLGLPARAAVQALDRLCDTAPGWVDRVGEIGFDDRVTDRLCLLIQQRLTGCAVTWAGVTGPVPAPGTGAPGHLVA